MNAVEQIISDVQTPPPPKADHDFVVVVATEYLMENMFNHLGTSAAAAAQIAAEWRPFMCGYQLAKVMDDKHGWEISSYDVEQLDGLDSVIRHKLSAARKDWAAKWNIQPPYPVGTRLKLRLGKEGVINSIYAHEGATYEVKEDGCTNGKRRILIKFEDAQPAMEGGAA